MRITIIASSQYPIAEPFAGGLERHTYQLALGLLQRGHDVTVHAAAGSTSELDVEAMCDERCRIDFSSAALDDPRALPEPFMLAHHAYLHTMLSLGDRDVDVVQNSSLHYLPVAMAPSVDVPVVTTLHTPPTPWLESALTAGPPGGASTFVSVSEANARAWQHAVRVREVIHNGVDIDGWPFGADPDPGLVVWTGRLVPEKGPHLAIEAAHAAGKRIVLAGPRDGLGYADEQVLPLLRDADAYVGHLEQDDLADLVGRAGAVLCTPTWEEPFGLVVIEALACGTPVVGLARGSLPELLDDETGVIVDGEDVDGLAAAIAAALRLDRRACRERARREFSLDAMVDRYESLYRRLAH